MAKKSNLLMAAVAVLAFAIPPSASAVTITSKAGTLAPVGTEITGTSTNFIMKTPLGNQTCALVTVKVKLTKNSAGTVEGVGGTNTTTECFFNGVTPIKVTDLTLPSLKSTEVGKGTLALTFVWDYPELSCDLSAATAPFTYTAGSDSLKLTNAKMVASPEACGPATLSADFTIEIGSTATILD